MKQPASPPSERTVTSEWTVDQVVTRYPETALVFVRRRMHCVGCDVAPFETLTDACRIYSQSLETLLADLEARIKRT